MKGLSSPRRLLALAPPPRSRLNWTRRRFWRGLNRKPGQRLRCSASTSARILRTGGEGHLFGTFHAATGQFYRASTGRRGCAADLLFAVNRSANRRVLYSINAGDARTSTVTSYLIDPANAGLRQIGQVPAGGAGPCYIAVDATDRFVVRGELQRRLGRVFRVQPDGTLSQPVQVVDFRGKPFGPHGPSQPGKTGRIRTRR